ncbi:hypothetical protein [Chryseobacterium shigense]|uniref:Uncharacterized protein n=1 Tax=Chryseobacterium shigense TaxID=297244 RepID=A0A841MWG2_9FLAO|nr:hypothetical protein [Chryseobacterium shigense]MBB6369296.1 hypothetical protein [Chryseobacterium shigense]
MKTKAHKLAQWAISIIIGYPILVLLLMIFIEDFSDSTGAILISGVIYLSVPILISTWFLTIWSLKLEKRFLGYVSLAFTLLYTIISIVFFCAIKHVKMC